jgi:hypothetical protein
MPRKTYAAYRDGQRQLRGRITRRTKHIGHPRALRRMALLLDREEVTSEATQRSR